MPVPRTEPRAVTSRGRRIRQRHARHGELKSAVAELARDVDIVDRVLGGDRSAFAEILRRHDDRLRGLAFRLLGGDRDLMDDALQEAYVRAYRALPAFRRDADLGSWLYRIVYNACIDEVRRLQRQAAPFDSTAAGTAWDPASPAPGPERAVVARDTAARALAGLPDIHRITVVLVDGEGFDTQTAARILGVAPETVRSRLWRARIALRRALGEENDS
jgi:RNA polymerase sigma-70 factor, ECF subfamily